MTKRTNKLINLRGLRRRRKLMGLRVKESEHDASEVSKRVNIVYPIVIGFLAGTLATFVGNVWSHRWLRDSSDKKTIK